jgi:hypothetical protein
MGYGIWDVGYRVGCKGRRKRDGKEEGRKLENV